MIRGLVKNFVFCAYCLGLISEGVYGMKSSPVTYKLDPLTDPKQLYLGRYDGKLTTKAIERSTELVSKNPLLNRTNADTLCDSLEKINKQLAQLGEEERLAFRIYLMGIAFNVPGECCSPEGDFKTIALANVLVHFVNSIEEFTKKWEEGSL